MPNERPTGADMILRSRRCKDQVLQVLKECPQARGDHMLLYIMVLKRFYSPYVKVTTRPRLSLEYKNFKAFFFCPAAETIRRRCQEIQSEERERIWKLVAMKHPTMSLQEMMHTPACIEEFCKYAAESEVLPRERTLRKRMRNELAHVHEFGKGQLSLGDFIYWDQP